MNNCVLIYLPPFDNKPGSMTSYVEYFKNFLESNGRNVNIWKNSSSLISNNNNKFIYIINIIYNYSLLFTKINYFKFDFVIYVSQEFFVPSFCNRSYCIVHDLTQLKYPRNNLIKYKVLFNLILIKLFKVKVICPSKSTSRKLKLIFDINSVVIPNQFHIELMEEIETIVEKSIIWVGNFLPHKNFDYVLRLAIKYVDIVFYCVVPKVPVNPQSYPSNLIFLSNIDDQSLYKIYLKSAYYLSTSDDEGFGRPVHEALAFGVPVIAKYLSSFISLQIKFKYHSYSQLEEIFNKLTFPLSVRKRKSVIYSNTTCTDYKYYNLLLKNINA